MPNGLPQPVDEPQPFGLPFDEPLEPDEPEQAPIVGGAPDPIPLLELPGADEPPPVDPRLVAQADELDALAPAVQPAEFAADVGQAPGVLPPDIVPTPEIGAAPVDFPEFEVPAADADVSPLAIAAGQNEAVRQQQDVVDAGRAEVANLNAQRGQLIRVLPTAKPKQQEKLAKKILQTDQAIAQASSDVEAARDGADVAQAQQESALGIAANRTREAAIANAQAEIEREQAKQDAELLENRDREAEATGQRDESIASYQRVIESGPSRSMGVMLADIAAEALNARLEKRTPNFGGALARHEKETSSIFARKQQAAINAIKTSGDRISDLAAQRRVMKAEGLERDAAIMARAVRQADDAIGIAQTDAQEAQATSIRDDLAQAAEQKRAQAAVARGQMIQAGRDRDLDRQLKEANIAKARAAAGKTELEAAKLARRGTGRGRAPESAGLIAANVVNVPGTDRALVTFKDDAQGRKEAASARDIIGEQQSFLEILNSARAFYEDADKQGLLGSLGVEGSKANERFTTINGVLQAKMAQIKAGPGKATTASDEEWAKQFIPDSPNAWSNKDRGLRKLDAALSVFEDESRSLLGRTTRLDAKTRERVVKQARKRGVSQTQRARTLASKAQETALDPKKSTATRVKSVDLIEENARLAGKESGIDWIPQAAAQIGRVALETDDPEVENAAFDKITKMQRFLEGRIVRRVNVLGVKAKFAPGMAEDREQLKRIEAQRLELAEKKVGQARKLLAGE